MTGLEQRLYILSNLNLMFNYRYVLVKYADRGLVENGTVSPLFETLYLVVGVTLLSVFFIFGSYYYFNNDPAKKSNFNLMCTRRSIDWSNFDAMKSITLVLAFTIPMIMVLIFMFIAILYFLRRRGMTKRVPPIIGNYRRNMLSLQETFAYTIIFFAYLYLNSFMLKFHNYFGFSVDMIRTWGFSSNLVFNNLLEGTIWPLFILRNLNKEMPQFYSNQNVCNPESIKHGFYIIGNTSLEPRRYCEDGISLNSKKIDINIKSTNKFNFLAKTYTNHSGFDVPALL